MKLVWQNPLTLIGFIIISSILLLAAIAPLIAPYDPNAIDVKAILLAPSQLHLMGTDGLGRDVFSRMLYGARISLMVGFVAVGIATLIGIVLGADRLLDMTRTMVNVGADLVTTAVVDSFDDPTPA
jgi:peptide/nickel transport system permease protein